MIRWFVFDLGNVVVKLAYERVLEAICADADCGRDELVRIMEKPGGYRDLERGDVTFADFHRFLYDQVGYRGDSATFRRVWSHFFDGPIEGIEELLDRVRRRYRVAFLSNSNEVHEQVIPHDFSVLFRKDDVFVFSHRFRSAKPDPEIYLHALAAIEAAPAEVVYLDDLHENVAAARQLGLHAIQFETAQQAARELELAGLLEPE